MPLYLPQRGGDADGAKSHCQSTKREELKMKNGVGVEKCKYLGRMSIQNLH